MNEHSCRCNFRGLSQLSQMSKLQDDELELGCHYQGLQLIQIL